MKGYKLIKLIFFLLFALAIGCAHSGGEGGLPEVSEGLPEGLSLLMEAVWQGDIAEIQRLLDQGYNVNETAEDGTTPVMFAVLLKKSEVVRFLMDNGADVNLPDKGRMTALTFAAIGQEPDVLEVILDRISVSKGSMSDLMILALWVGDLKGTETLLGYGASATMVGERSGITPLDFAVENRFSEAAELLQ